MRTLKRVFICILSFTILSSMIGLDKVCLANAAEAEETTQGIPEGYTEIKDIADLYGIRNNLSGKYILTEDIDMSEATSEGGDYDCGTGWDSIETFKGVLDGNGHRIIGMHIFGNVQSSVGLFESISGATIKKLGIVDCDISVPGGIRYFGAIAGYCYDSSIDGCYASGDIKVEGVGRSDNDICIGGLVGEGFGQYREVEISNCYNLCNIDCSELTNYYKIYISGIIGYCRNFKITNLYNIGTIKGNANSNIGAICGYFNYAGALENCSYLKASANQGVGNHSDNANCVVLSEGQMKTPQCFTGFDFDTVWEIDLYCSYPYPQLKNNRMIRVDSLNLKTAPQKLVYNQGDALKIGGAVVEISYEDGIKTSVLVTLDMLNGYDMMEIGKQTVVISYGGAETSFDIEVKEIPVASISIPEKLFIQRSKEQKLEVTILPENASNQSVEWESSVPSVASVDDTGLVKAKSQGTTIVTVTSANGLTAECEVTVEIPAVSVNLNKTALALKKGESEILIAGTLPLESTDIVEWKSSDTTVAEVEDGVVEAKGAGRAAITAYTKSGVEATCEVTVQVPTVSMQLDETALTLKKGDQKTLTVWISPLDSTDIVEWKSSDTTVAEVKDGVVEAKGAGKATITAYTKNGVEVACEVTVPRDEASSNKDNSNTTYDNSDTNSKNDENTVAVKKVNTIKAKIKSAKNVKNKSIKLKLSGLSDCDGYEIQYATNKNFKSAKKIAKKSSSVTIKKLKKKTYYVRVRVYKKIDGKTYCGKWSSKKTVKVKI